ncbi:MAG: MFS transporter [Treponemataceae bacterium]
MGSLTQFQIKTGRRIYDFFNATNSFSFALITGNILTLYALYLGASSATIGLITAFGSLSFFAIPLGKFFCKKSSIMAVYANAWMVRTCTLCLMLPIPFLVASGYPQHGLFLIILSALLFNFTRGIGMVANNPVLHDLAPGKDRGSYLVKLSLINNTFALLANLLMTILLIKLPSALAFNIGVIGGIIFGFFSTFSLYKMPSPQKKVTPESKKESSFLRNFSVAIRDLNFRLFIAAFSIIGFAVGMARPFIVVYCREVYKLNTGMISIISLFSVLGALFMGYVTRVFIDRIGAKPMYMFFSILSFLSLVPAIIAPQFSITFFLPVFLCIVALLTNFGFAGEENAAQTYFFTIVPPHALLDLSIVYYFILGATGAMGSLFGGVILDSFSQSNFSPIVSFRLFFSLQLFLIATGLYIILKLKAMGSYSLKDALPLFFSPRDIKALSLLYKLDHTSDAEEQANILEELTETNSKTASENLLEFLDSPQFFVRLKALYTLETMPSLTDDIICVLLRELEKGSFTTAFQAAKLLGKFKIKQAIPCLRTCIQSEDYFLSGESMIALSRLNDPKGQLIISDIAAETKNPHLLLWAIHAMQIYANSTSILTLQNILRLDFNIDDIHAETILAFAKIMGIHKLFYKIYALYKKDNLLGEELLRDFFDDQKGKKTNKNATTCCDFISFYEDSSHSACIQQLVARKPKSTGINSALMLSSIFDTDLTRLQSYRFFLVFWFIAIQTNAKLLNN